MSAAIYLLYTELSLSLMFMLGLVVVVFAVYVLYQCIRNSPFRAKERELRAQHKREMAELEHRHQMRQQEQYNRIALARERMNASVTIYNEAAAHLAKIDHSLQQHKTDSNEALESLREIARVTAFRLAAIGSEAQEESDADAAADNAPETPPATAEPESPQSIEAATLAPAAPFIAAAPADS